MTLPFPTPLRIATRKSDLALWQARTIQALLRTLACDSELVLIETQGDREYLAFKQMAGQGFFTKAVQDAVLAGEADLAVHSLKDLPSAPFPGLALAAIPCRAAVHDLLLLLPDVFDPSDGFLPLRPQTLVGTSAIRRQDQLRLSRPDLQLRELRGNVPTRLEKLRRREYEAILLAAAGIERLQLSLTGLHVVPMSPKTFLPAPGQGALALETRTQDTELRAFLLTHLHEETAARSALLERAVMSLVAGGCQLALGAHASFQDGHPPELSLFFKETTYTLQAPSSHALLFEAARCLGLASSPPLASASRLLSLAPLETSASAAPPASHASCGPSGSHGSSG